MRRRAQLIIGKGQYGLWGLMMVLLVMGSISTAGTAHADPGAGTMNVVVPAPTGTTAQGPINTNVSLSMSQATVGVTYNLGWAKQSDGCASGFTAFPGVQPITADSSGNFSTTVTWPDAASDTSALYLICASDTANPTTDVVTAVQQFQVLGSAAPQITLSQAPSSTRTGKIFDAGGPVEVRGKNFFPQNTAIEIFVTTSDSFTAQDFQSGTALKTKDGSQITSDSQGQFTAIVLLPQDAITGQLFIHAVSTDAVTQTQPMFPPSLVSSQNIQIGPPQPTPTIQPTATVGTKTGTGHNATSHDNTGRIVAIAGLGGLALILFIVGSILIASAVLGSGSPPSLDNGARSHPDAVRSGPQW